jgi:pyridoxal phosphate enzyme (YggS family)
MPDIKENLLRLKERISSAAKRLGKDVSGITLVAATKDVPAALIKNAVDAGIRQIGENKVQEAEAKYEALKDLSIEWHMIGHLQTNKVKKALSIFSVIQSVDSSRLAEKISTEAQKTGKKVDIFLEINTSGEASKYGIIPEKAAETAEHVSKLPNLSLKGLMTVGPFTADENKVRNSFKLLKNLSEQIASKNLPNVEMKYLSMGMTDDFETAIEEGSNLIRVGRAIFGIPHKY